jgi:hypothetical protein
MTHSVNHLHTPTSYKTSAGAVTILTCTILMALISMAILYLNRGVITDQQIASNQVKSITAAAAAEAGIEWAIGMLNAANTIDGACNLNPSTATLAFRDIYGVAASTPATAPSCKIVTQNTPPTLQCSCPSAGATPLPSSELPGFSVAISKIDSDPDALQLAATGCTAFSGVCTPSLATSNGGPDAIASVKIMVKLRPLLRSSPSAAMTCAGNCQLGSGSITLRNTSLAANGILINAGGTATQLPNTAITLPGTPAANAVISGDSSLAQLKASDPSCTKGEVFKAFFGATIDEYKASPSVFPLPTCSGATCATAIQLAISQGWRNFYFPSGVTINSNVSLGSSNDPITIVADGNSSVRLNGNAQIFGLLFVNRADVDFQGTGSMNIQGGLMSCEDLTATGNGAITYDYNIINTARKTAGTYAKIPGSWSALQ